MNKVKESFLLQTESKDSSCTLWSFPCCVSSSFGTALHDLLKWLQTLWFHDRWLLTLLTWYFHSLISLNKSYWLKILTTCVEQTCFHKGIKVRRFSLAAYAVQAEAGSRSPSPKAPCKAPGRRCPRARRAAACPCNSGKGLLSAERGPSCLESTK